MVKLTIDGQRTEVPAGSAILDAAKRLGIDIPTLCYLDMEEKFNQQAAACRICVVEVEGRRNLALPVPPRSWKAWSSRPTPSGFTPHGRWSST